MFEKIPKFSWLALILIMFVGLTMYQNMWETYWSVWLTAAMMFFAVTMYFFRPGVYTGLGVMFTNIMWFVNQIIEWTGYGSPTVFAGTFVATLVMVIMMLATLNRNEEHEGKLLASSGFVILIIFAFLKLYSLSLHGTSYILGASASGNLWALGLMMMSAGGLLKIFVSEDNGKFSGTITLIGLIIVAIASLAFGSALSIFAPLTF